MPEVIETTVYRLNELSDAAKDKARVRGDIYGGRLSDNYDGR